MAITEIIGVLGFILAIVTFVLTRLERRKKLLFDIYCGELEDIEFDGTVYGDETRLIIMEIINSGSKPIVIDKDSKCFYIDGKIIQHDLDWFYDGGIPKPLLPGQSHRLAVFLDSAITVAELPNKNSGQHKISCEVKDIENKKYTSKRKFQLILDINEVIKK